MLHDVVQLRHAGGIPFVRLRALTGFDEREVGGAGSRSAIALVDRLLDGGPDAPSAGSITVSDRDRLLAAVYRRIYRDRIESTVKCDQCDRAFDLSFSLTEMEIRIPAEPGRAEEWLSTPTGVRFRRPTGEDELAAFDTEPEQRVSALRTRIAPESSAGDAPSIDEALERAAPVLDLDLDAACPECGQHRKLRFNLQQYLLGRILNERRRLLNDVHQLATAYGWRFDDILSMLREERRAMVETLEAAMRSSRRLQ